MCERTSFASSMNLVVKGKFRPRLGFHLLISRGPLNVFNLYQIYIYISKKSMR